MSRQPATPAALGLLQWLADRRDAARSNAREHDEAGASGMAHVARIWSDCFDRVLRDIQGDLVEIEHQAAEIATGSRAA